MTVRWLAALLVPDDIAPHPNFGLKGQVDPEQLAALLVQARWRDFERYLERPGVPDGAAVDVPLRMRDALFSETAASGSLSLLNVALEEENGLALRAACAAISCVSLCELDRHEEALTGLSAVLESSEAATTDDRLVLAFTAVQRSMRLRETGVRNTEDLQFASDLLSQCKPSDAARFKVRAGLRSQSPTTVSRLKGALERAVQENGLAFDTVVNFSAWSRLAQTEEPVAKRRPSRRALSGYVNMTFELFRSRLDVRDGFVATSGDIVDSGVYAAYLNGELVGGLPSAWTWRERLGVLRFVRQSWAHSSDEQQEGLRLLRHADDLKRVEQAVSFLRSAGSLKALRGEATQIVQHRLAARLLRSVDLVVLRGTADLMSAVEASDALDGILSAIDIDLPAPSRRNEDLGIRLEHAWRAAGVLADVADRTEHVAQELLRHSIEETNNDFLVHRALIRGTININWDQVSTTTKASWIEFLSSSSPSAAALRQRVGDIFGLVADVSDDADIGTAASLVNILARREEAVPPLSLLRATEIAQNAVERVVESAVAGVYLGYSFDPGQIAAGLLIFGRQQALWAPLVRLLLEPRVTRGDKRLALELLSAERPDMPAEVRSYFLSNVGAILDTASRVPLESDSGLPFPQALRFLAAYKLVPMPVLLTSLVSLATSADPADRIESGKVLSVLWEDDSGPSWTLSMLLTLSHDAAAACRAEIGRLLAAGRFAGLEGVVDARLGELLREDGLVVPLYCLQGLLESRRPIAEDIQPFLREAAQTHLSRSVRHLAAELANSP